MDEHSMDEHSIQCSNGWVHFQVSLELRLTFVVKDDLTALGRALKQCLLTRFTITIVKCCELFLKSDQDFCIPVWNVLLNPWQAKPSILADSLVRDCQAPAKKDATWSWGRGREVTNGSHIGWRRKGPQWVWGSGNGETSKVWEEKHKSRESSLWLKKLPESPKWPRVALVHLVFQFTSNTHAKYGTRRY